VSGDKEWIFADHEIPTDGGVPGAIGTPEPQAQSLRGFAPALRQVPEIALPAPAGVDVVPSRAGADTQALDTHRQSDARARKVEPEWARRNRLAQIERHVIPFLGVCLSLR
jgi:hypothetical protein